MYNCCLAAYAVSVLDILMRTMNEYAPHSYILTDICIKNSLFVFGGCRYNLLEFYLDFIFAKSVFALLYTLAYLPIFVYLLTIFYADFKNAIGFC